MQEQPFDTFGTNSCVKISDHTYFSPDHLGGTAMTLRHMKIFVAVYQHASGSAVRQPGDQGAGGILSYPPVRPPLPTDLPDGERASLL